MPPFSQNQIEVALAMQPNSIINLTADGVGWDMYAHILP